LKNRGDFTENFSVERLARVFGRNNVFANINIDSGNGKIVGEIDVLVLYANRAIILQAKSKKLTIEARQGNKDKMSSDFQKANQDAYDQGYACAEFLQNSAQYTLLDPDGNILNNTVPLKEVYIMCVVSDHYPALFIQSRQFLKYKETEVIKSPYIGDLFLLDTITEFLTSPIQFLSFINRRTSYADRIFASSELIVFAHHLNTNLKDEEHEPINSRLWAETSPLPTWVNRQCDAEVNNMKRYHFQIASLYVRVKARDKHQTAIRCLSITTLQNDKGKDCDRHPPHHV
jgi:hypothetical protein